MNKDVFDTLAELEPVDPGLMEMLPAQTAEFLRQCPEIAAHGKKEMNDCRARNAALTKQLDEFKAALEEYAIQSGGGQILMNNFRLCLEQVQMRKLRGQ